MALLLRLAHRARDFDLYFKNGARVVPDCHIVPGNTTIANRVFDGAVLQSSFEAISMA